MFPAVIIAALLVSSCNNNKDKAATQNGVATIPPYTNYLTNQVKEHPDSVGLRLMLAASLDSAGAYQQALTQVDSLLQKDSLNNGLWFTKAQVLEHAKDTFAAIAAYKNTIAIYPSPQALLALTNLYAETKNPKALELCQRINDLRMGREYDSYTAFFTGVYYEHTGNSKQALHWLDESISNNYTFIDAYMEKGFVYYDTKQYSEALKIFNTAATVNNTYADAYYWQGKTYEALQKKQEAKEKYQQALSLNKNLQEAAEGIKRLE
ncbi:hypothetical protein F5148DRAFT_1291375 [Russula earlei]|uniref:Uncharacterized protein n=1 Tax=Russula earlei TaxID=71964 RepID=A0ACC0TUD8_9AGAM|nr:hypothetical protein F5148DRAFT_1291375 [Russula earlei]